MLALALPPGLIAAAYIVASILFILSLGGLSHQETARRGNWFGICGMLIALVATALDPRMERVALMLAALLIGGTIGIYRARRLAMTEMPQLVALLHSFVGLAAVLVGVSTYVSAGGPLGEPEQSILEVEIYLGVLIGAVTFTGSLIAFGKLQGLIDSKPLLLPLRHGLNLVALLLCIWLGNRFVAGDSIWPLLLMLVVALAFGLHMVMAIGGADMPVVVSMLNSYSGWAAAATGFTLANDLLIVTGALVGSSGAILSYIMCRAMNRRFISVIIGGFGGAASVPAGAASEQGEQGAVAAISEAECAECLDRIESLVIVPGYGMAVAHAQHAVSALAQRLRDRGVRVRFAIHPVAGRMPGHMNVLLAEARISYDIVLEMDEIQADLATTDLVMVIGANDIVNPSALDSADSPIAGMPVIRAWQAKQVVVLKRSMASGYAGVENPLFFKPNTRMLFGDAKSSVEALVSRIA